MMARAEGDLLQDLLNTQPGQGHIEYQRPEQPSVKPAQQVTGYTRKAARRAARAPRFDYGALTMRAAGMAALLVWLVLWGVDGYFTASFIQRVAGVSLWIGGVVHLVISLVQQHLWRLGWREHWMLIVPISGLNISTTVVGLWQAGADATRERPFDVFDIMQITVPQSVILFWGAVIAGIAIAVWPERKASQAAHELF